MITFPNKLKHDSGVMMSLDTSRLLLAFKEPPQREILERSLGENDLILESQKERRAVKPSNSINHTKDRFWICSRNGEPMRPEQSRFIQEKLDNQLEWIGPVYRLADTNGLGGLVCPFPNVLLIKAKNIPDGGPDLLPQILLRYGLREIPEKSKYLGDYRYFMLSDPKNGGVYSLRDTLLEKEGDSIDETHFENMPLLSLLAYMPLEPLFSNQWNMKMVKAGGWTTTGWDITTGSNAIVIAILDTGCDLHHPDLHFYTNGINLGSMSGDGSPAGDELEIGHGTCCAGIAAARIGNQIGVAGMAGNCVILPVAFQNMTDAEAAAGIRYAADNGAKVISMSFGGYGPGENVVGPDGDTRPSGINFSIIDPAIAYAANVKGCVLCAAAGNDNVGDYLLYPARNPLVIAVGASDEADNRKSPTSPDGETNWGSNFGPGLSVVAPGVHIPTTDIQGAKGFDSGDYFLSFNGTSAATPHVAGLAALILSLHPNLSNQTVRGILETTADKIGSYTYTSAPSHPSGTWSDEAGYGRINVLAALECALNIFSDPPFVSCVQAYANGNAGPVRKYLGKWEYAFGQFQLKRESEPVIPNQQAVDLIVDFDCTVHSGGLSWGMDDNSVRLTLVGKNPVTNGNIDIPVGLHRVGPTRYSGSFLPENLGTPYTLGLRIDGSDKLRRFSLRNPKGDAIDTNPQTWAAADLNNPPYYPYLNYEPGTDANHQIAIGTLTTGLPPDYLEPNNDFATATQVYLPMSTIGEPVSKDFQALSLHNATDEDYFFVQFETGVQNQSGSGGKPRHLLVSRYLGLSVSYVPDCINVQLSSGSNFVDLVIYQSDTFGRQVIASIPRASIFAPADLGVFGENKFYAMVRNTNYSVQGALEYGISFMFTPGYYHSSIDWNAPAYRARPTFAGEILGSYYDHVNLPRPQEETANMLPYGQQAFRIPDLVSFIRRSEEYYRQPQCAKKINSITESKSHTDAVLAEIMYNLGNLAFTAGRNTEARGLYQKCLKRISKLGRGTASLSAIRAMKKTMQKRLAVLINSKIEKSPGG